MQFKLKSKFKPAGDQPEAINQLSKNLKTGVKDQVLLGVTGSGKTMTMANVIVFPLPVTPKSTWSFTPVFKFFDSWFMASGWSPAGLNFDFSLNCIYNNTNKA